MAGTDDRRDAEGAEGRRKKLLPQMNADREGGRIFPSSAFICGNCSSPSPLL